MPEGETVETCQEHVKAMNKEMAQPSNRNLAMVNELMELTHSLRRQWFLQDNGTNKQKKLSLFLTSTLIIRIGRIMISIDSPKGCVV